jgi:signal transduction histidine kinase
VGLPAQRKSDVSAVSRFSGRLAQGRQLSGGPSALAGAGFTVEVTGWRGVAAFRWLTLVYALALNLNDLGRVSGPGWCLVTLAVMVVWSVFTTVAYASPHHRAAWLHIADLAVTVATILATLLVESRARLDGGEFTVPTVWAASVVLAWALRWEVIGGLLATLGLAAADLVVDAGHPTQLTIHNIVLVLLAGIVVGYVAEVLRRVERMMAEALREQGAVLERARLARQIHDGVLQVLALVRRRGAELGGEAGQLAELAGEQEVALRSLIISDGRLARAAEGGTQPDLAAVLGPFAASPSVQLVAPAHPVRLDFDVAAELAAAVGAALHNVAEHAPGAQAWIVLEEIDSDVLVTVRDDGPGIPPGRLEAAAAAGRLGVTESIRGRLRALGGSATVISTPGEGTEVELRVPSA